MRCGMNDPTDSLTGGAASVLSEGKEAAGNTVRAVKDAAGRTADHVTEMGEQAYTRGKEAAQSAARQLKEEPVAAMLMAGAIGIAIGYVLARR